MELELPQDFHSALTQSTTLNHRKNVITECLLKKRIHIIRRIVTIYYYDYKR